MKYTITYILLFLSIHLSYSQVTNLDPGDVVIIGFNTNDPDEFAFAILKDITAGTSIKFTDRGWNNNAGGSFRNADLDQEGTLTWSTTTDVSCGTQINIIENNSGVFNASSGNLTETNHFDLIIGGFSFPGSGRGEQILVYQGTDANPNFIFGLDYSQNQFSNNSTSTSNDTSALPNTLSFGVGNSAVNHRTVAYGRTSCTSRNLGQVNQFEVLEAATSGEGSGWTFGDGRQPIGNCNIVCLTCRQTRWRGNFWENGIVPSATIGAIITGTYDTSVNGSFTTCTLDINNGANLIVRNSRFVKVINDVVNNGTLTVETQGNFVQVEDDSNFTDNGRSQVDKRTAVKSDWFFYTFWGSPVTNARVDDVFANRPADRRFRFDGDNFLDVFVNETGRPDISIIPGHDGIDDNNDGYQFINGADILEPGRAYAITENPIGFVTGQFQALFEGEFNNGLITTPIFYNSLNTRVINGQEGAHFNFIANPYASAIDFSLFHAENANLIDGVAYLWSQSRPPLANNAGNQGLNFNQNDYAIINVTGGIAGPSGTIPDSYIPSAQGFFIRSRTDGNLTFNNAMRVATENSNLNFFGIENNDVTFQASQQTLQQTNNQFITEDNKIWITLTSNNGIFNQVMTGYVNGATNGYDGATYDAPRISPGGTTALLYTMIDDNATIYAIQGRDSGSLTQNEVIPLGFDTNIDIETLYNISLTQFKGLFFENSTVFLKDSLLDITHDLSESDYEFTSETGTFNNRFQIEFVSQNRPQQDNELAIPDNEFLIIELENGDLQFSIANNLEMKSIKIIDLTGKIVYDLEAKGNTVTYNLPQLNNSVYIAQITLTDGVIITKKALKQ